MLEMRVVTVRGSLMVLSLVAAACSAPLQPQGTGSGGNGGSGGVAGTTGIAGTTGAAGAAGVGAATGACVLNYNSALVDPSADACCAWAGGPNVCDRAVACNDKSGPGCCLIYATSATIGGPGCCLYANGTTPSTPHGDDRTAECAALLSGTTGIGGSTGTGGSGDDGGLPPFDAGAPACAQVLQAPASPWTFGFQPTPDPPGTFHAVVTEVAADHLTLQRDGGESVTFRWAGPSLAAEFSVAESVSCETTAARWHVVKGARRTAEIQIGNSMTLIPQSGDFPAGGTFTLEPDCATASASSCVGAATPIVHTFYRVVASLNGDSVTIPPQAGATLGALQITNVFNDWSIGGSNGLCHYDFSNVGLISVLGPP
jgi:hypothetical protein